MAIPGARRSIARRRGSDPGHLRVSTRARRTGCVVVWHARRVSRFSHRVLPGNVREWSLRVRVSGEGDIARPVPRRAGADLTDVCARRPRIIRAAIVHDHSAFGRVPVRFLLGVLWILIGCVINGSLYWLFLNTPESTVWTLAASAVLGLIIIIIDGLTVT